CQVVRYAGHREDAAVGRRRVIEMAGNGDGPRERLFRQPGSGREPDRQATGELGVVRPLSTDVHRREASVIGEPARTRLEEAGAPAFARPDEPRHMQRFVPEARGPKRRWDRGRDWRARE